MSDDTKPKLAPCVDCGHKAERHRFKGCTVELYVGPGVDDYSRVYEKCACTRKIFSKVGGA